MKRIEILPFPLAPYQEKFLNNRHRFTAVEASTKAGKTAGCIYWAVQQWHDFSFPVGWETTWCAPVYNQSRIAYDRIKRAIPKSYDVNDTRLTIFTPRGDELRFKSADDVNNLYGPDARAVIFEEYTRCRNVLAAFKALRSTLTATNGKMKLIGNYIGQANAGHQLAVSMANNPEWAHFIVTAQHAVEAGIMKQSELDQARMDMSPSDFLALYMCQGSNHPLQLVRSDAISSLWTNTHVPSGDPRMAVDVARFGRDRTVITVAHGLQVLHVETHDQTDIPEVARLVTQAATRFAIPRHAIVVDEGGVGGGVVDLLPGCIPFNGGAAQVKVKGDLNYGNLRAQCWYRAADIINSGGMWVKTDDHRDSLAMELEVVRRAEDMAEGKLKVIKKDEMKSLLGRSPDIGDTLMMLMWFELKAPTSTFEDAIAGHAKAEVERRFKEFTHAHFPVMGADRDQDGY